MKKTRREILKAGALASAASFPFLSGCSNGTSKSTASPNTTKAAIEHTADLVIDTHAHIFNGTDLQVSNFVSRVAVSEVEASAIRFLAKVMGPVLQGIAWLTAPTAKQELGVLENLNAGTFLTDAESLSARRIKEQQYQKARDELIRVAEEVEAQGLSESLEGLEQRQALESLKSLPELYEDFKALQEQEPESLSGFLKKLNAARRFVVEMLQYRHVSIENFFDAYPSVDLATPSLVDYDWWLSKGKPTLSSFEDQVAVNKQLAILSKGRIHPFFGFDPFKQAVWDCAGGDCGETDLGDMSPLQWLEKAIDECGFIGVKLYPPMGFSMWNNKQFADATIWQNKSWLHDFVKRPDFADRLDNSMHQLYEYCSHQDRQIPIMAHSSRSNKADKDFEPLLPIERWAAVYENYGVKLSMGHFSGFGDSAEEEWTGAIDVLLAEQDITNPKRFADVSYFNSFFADDDRIVELFDEILFRDGQVTGISNQLLYGSDWKMLLMEPGSENYLNLLKGILRKLERELPESRGSELTAKVLGRNAVKFLGLARGGKNRNRLETFYADNQMSEPQWFNKVDT